MPKSRVNCEKQRFYTREQARAAARLAPFQTYRCEHGCTFGGGATPKRAWHFGHRPGSKYKARRNR